MADVFGLLTPEQQIEAAKIERRRRVAEAMLGPALQPGDTQYVPGPVPIAVRRSPLDAFARAAVGYAAGRQGEDADRQLSDLARKSREEVAAAMAGYERDTTPRAAVSGELQEDAAGNVYRTDDQPAYTPSAADRRTAAMRLATSVGAAPAVANALVADAFRRPTTKNVDLGDRIGVLDEAGNIVSTLPKAATPDARLRSDTTLYTHQTPSGSAVLSEQGAQRRHETPSGSSVLSAQTTIRGQNMTDARAREMAAIARETGRIPQGYRFNADGTALEAIPGGPADIGRALPTPAVRDLSNAGAAVEDSRRLLNTFHDRYGGKTILGGMSNTFGRVFGDSTGQSQWWQDMDALQNQTRHALFGSALTKTELAAWEKTSITPRMDPQQIRENLTRRSEIEARAASKLARAYAAGGYNRQQIGELLGVGAQYLNTPAPPTGSGGRTRDDILRQYGVQ